MRARILSRVTLIATIALVTLGAYTRGSGSGYGCRDSWPLCENGLLGGLLPRADFHMIVEWSHRWVAAMVGVLAVVTAIYAWREARRWVAYVAIGAVFVIGVQAWVGRLIVTNQLDADLVLLHLFISMTIAGLLAVVVVATTAHRSASPSVGWAMRFGVGAALALGLLLAGAYVHNLYIEGWPLVQGDLIPSFDNKYVTVHWLHRLLAVVVLGYLIYVADAARRSRRPATEQSLGWLVLGAHAVNIGLGAAHVFTKVSSSLLVSAHVLMAGLVLTGLVAATAVAAGVRAGDDQPARSPQSTV